MPSKQVTDRRRSANAVIASAEANHQAIGQKLNQLHAPLYPPGAAGLTDYRQVIKDQGRLLGLALKEMLDRDAANEKEQRDDPPVQRGRDASAEELRQHILRLKRSVLGLYGEETVAALGLAGTISDDPLTLSGLAKEVQSNAASLTLPPPLLPGASFSLGPVLAVIDQHRTTLDGFLEGVNREERELQQTVKDKKAAIDAYDARFSAVATTLSGLYRLAGEEELARKIRPSSRRPGQLEEDPPEEPTGGTS